MVGALPLQDVEDIEGHGNGPDPPVRDWSTRERGRAQMMWAAQAPADEPPGRLPGRRRLGKAAAARIA
jgi:hypothetical protein